MVVPQRLLDARVVPWSSWDEWGDVVRLLSLSSKDGSGIEGIREAQRVLSMWRLRRSAAIPIAYQALVSLRALLSPLPLSDSYEWRLSVAMCVVRLVNGLTDRLQGARARSVKYLAEQLQLPTVLVHIRHQATHGTLPTAKQLRAAAAAAVAWIENHYIAPQRDAANACDAGGKNEGMEEMRQIFCGDYSNCTCPQLPGNTPATAADTDVLLKMKECIQRAQRNKNNSTERVTGGICKRPTPSGKKRQKWVLCTGDEANWASMPLGLCPWQTKVGTNLAGKHAIAAGTENNNTNVIASNNNSNSKKSKMSAEDIMYVKKARAALVLRNKT